MPRNYDHVLSFALDHPWAITRPMLTVVAGIIARRIAGQDDHDAIDAALVNRKTLPQPRAGGSVAIIPVYGVLAPRLNMMTELSGGTTFEKLTAQLRTCVADQAIKTIVLDVDSPGGNVAGLTEFSRELLKARAKKPIIGQVQYTGASAAYGLLACCTEIAAAPSSRIGSIGVYTSHDDISEALKAHGITRTYISAGTGKVDGNPTTPLTPEAHARIQTMVDEAYGLMVGDIVKGRGQGVTAGRVKDEWRALLYSAAEAKGLGMIDRIATLDETLERCLPGGGTNDALAALTTPLDPLSIAPASGTAQEPARATAQDRTAEAALERQLFELSI